jgi:hypothetical protein
MTAARYTLQQPLIPAQFLGIDLTTASDLLALLTYHQKCSIAVEPLLTNLEWVQSHYVNLHGYGWLFCEKSANGHQRNRYNTDDCKRSTEAEFELWSTPPVAWWVTYMKKTFKILRDRPTGDNVRAEARETIQEVINAGCKDCAARVKLHMTDFSDLLALKVTEATALVRILI